MNKDKLGNKHLCSNCGTKFFDLKKETPVCPNCGTEIIVRTKPRLGRPPLNKNKEKDNLKSKPGESITKPNIIEEDEIEITEDIDNVVSFEDLDTEDEISETNENIDLISEENNEENISNISEIDINNKNTED